MEWSDVFAARIDQLKAQLDTPKGAHKRHSRNLRTSWMTNGRMGVVRRCCKSYLTPQSGAAVALAVGQLWWRDFVSAGSTMPQRCPASSPVLGPRLQAKARAYPRSDAHCPRLGNVADMRGLPARGRSRPKKLVRRRQQHPVRLATLNLGTLTGRSRELADSLRKRRVDICCLQETRWKGSKARELGDGYKLIYHGTSNRNGVGIILNESFRNSVTAMDRLSDRLMAVKVDTGEVELRVVSAYAPQMGCSEERRRAFGKIWSRDFNGHVGSRKDGFESCHGGYGYGARNDDGLRILEYAVASDLIIANTQYRKRKSHLITYTSGGRETQMISGCYADEIADFCRIQKSSL
ncbi:hypothetical protein RB195_005571 [Necator americanus]|uniref:Endonuclease/exonuclease/phosphatase domain-containing protein n=1 Tax=Necator americanus TaxID=51031 RepID=A0ABR1BSH1_NECAM